MEDVGKTKTCGVQGVIVCSPDIKTENENSQVEQVQADHNLEDIVSADKDRGNSTEEKHQGISDKESHNRGDGTRFPFFANVRSLELRFRRKRRSRHQTIRSA